MEDPFDEMVAGLGSPEHLVHLSTITGLPPSGVVQINGDTFDYWTTDAGEMVCLSHGPWDDES